MGTQKTHQMVFFYLSRSRRLHRPGTIQRPSLNPSKCRHPPPCRHLRSIVTIDDPEELPQPETGVLNHETT